jgi:hypothetical protein
MGESFDVRTLKTPVRTPQEYSSLAEKRAHTFIAPNEATSSKPQK